MWEALSSWCDRLARPYGLSARELFIHNLGLGEEVVVPWNVDHDPPAALLVALGERSGVSISVLRSMTVAGWAPWLFDTYHYRRPGDDQETFDTYVRANPVLLAPGEAGTHRVGYPNPWYGPWHGGPHSPRVCPVCAVDPDRPSALVWQLPLTIGCGEHGCRLENSKRIRMALARGERLPEPTPADGPLATLDDYTYTALATGRVRLPGRPVHAGVWFRLLRSLLDEVSLAPSALRPHAATMVEQVWAATGLPPAGGLLAWRPYEELGWHTQRAMLRAAGTALRLVAAGQIVPRGKLGSALHPGSASYVHNEDPSGAPPTAR